MSPTSYTKFRTEWSGLSSAFMRAWPARTAIVPAFAGVKSIDELERQIRDLVDESRQAGRRLPMGANALATILARADQKFSMQMSAGPVDPRQQNPNAAWKIPVRRIKSRYYQGWMVRRVAPGVWMVYNPTREAYYIEYGIHVSANRVRRPVRKMALIKTLHLADRTGVGNMVWEYIFSPFRKHGNSGILGVSPQSAGVMPFLGSGFQL